MANDPATPPATPPAGTPPAASTPPAAPPADPTTVLGQEPPKTPEQKPGETPPKDGEKPGEQKPPEQKPVEVDIKALKMPEGYKLDEAQFKEVNTILTDPNVSPQDRMQKLIDYHAKSLREVSEAGSKAWDDANVKWTKEVAADKEVGSGNDKSPLKPEVAERISKTIDQFGGKELRDALNLTGAGSHPAVVRAFDKMAKLLTEGKHVGGNPPSPKAKGPGAASLYPDNPP